MTGSSPHAKPYDAAAGAGYAQLRSQGQAAAAQPAPSDFQIEADFIGLMAPGLPNAARDYSMRVGQVMNFGDGLYGGLFVTGMYAAAFFERDVRRVVEAGLALMPQASSYAAIIRDVLAWHAADPTNWRVTPRTRAPMDRCGRSTSTRG